MSASSDNTAKLWEAHTGVPILTLKGHANAVISASFSPDGSRIVTAGLDNAVKVWDATPINREFLPPGRAAETSRVKGELRVQVKLVRASMRIAVEPVDQRPRE